jgi:hypothetical protein
MSSAVGRSDKGRAADERDCRDPMAETADETGNLVGGNSHGEISDCENRLVEHQDDDDRAG